MNSLLIFPAELASPCRAVLRGKRFDQANAAQSLQMGNKLRVSLLGGGRGFAIVTALSAGVVELQLDELELPLPRLPLHLVVAVPRPQTLKKVLFSAANLGVAALHFVRSANVEKSYLKSHSLRQESIQKEIYKALEQSTDSLPPRVCVHDRFRPFVEDILPAELADFSPNAARLVCQSASEPRALLSRSVLPRSAACCYCIGPEMGWNDFELQLFRRVGFEEYDLGERILRVEVAVDVVLGQALLCQHSAVDFKARVSTNS